MTDTNMQTTNNAETTISRFLNGAKALGKAFAKIEGADQALFDQRVETQQCREAVSAALAGDGDFDAASKAFKVANNKLDKLMDAGNGALANARAGVDALRRALDALADDLSAMEARA